MNGNKAWGRRATTSAVVIILTTVAYYVSLFKGMAVEWFIEYAKVMIYILGFVVGGLTITDGIMNWRAKNGDIPDKRV